jgi:hypothetical protein
MSKELINIKPRNSPQPTPALLFRWQKFPLELVSIGASPANYFNGYVYTNIRVWYYRGTELFARNMCIPCEPNRIPAMRYDTAFNVPGLPPGLDPVCLEKFYRLAHWHITALAIRDGEISAEPPASLSG